MMPTKAISTSLRLAQRPKASDHGAWARSPLASRAANTGLSESLRRIHSEIASRPAEKGNGRGQPPLHPAPANCGAPSQGRLGRVDATAPTRAEAAADSAAPPALPGRARRAASVT